jgi:hypothetical protein
MGQDVRTSSIPIDPDHESSPGERGHFQLNVIPKSQLVIDLDACCFDETVSFAFGRHLR